MKLVKCHFSHFKVFISNGQFDFNLGKGLNTLTIMTVDAICEDKKALGLLNQFKKVIQNFGHRPF